MTITKLRTAPVHDTHSASTAVRDIEKVINDLIVESAQPNEWSSIVNTPTTIAGYGITDVNAYAPALDGTGAIGTWPISILGSATTVTGAAQPAITSVGTLAGLTLVNAGWLKWRNGADTADLNILRTSVGNNTVLNAVAGSAVIQQVGEVTVTTLTSSTFSVAGAIAVTGNAVIDGNLTMDGSGGKYIAFRRNDGAPNVGGIGWHTDTAFYVGGHPSLSGTAGSPVRVRGFSGDLALGTNALGDIITIIGSTGSVSVSKDVHLGSVEEGWNLRVSGASTSARFRVKNRVLADGVYLQSVNSAETLQSSMTFAASGFTFETGDVGIGLAPVGANRVLAVGSTARATTYIRAVSQTVGETWFESLVSGALEMFVGLNNSGVASRGIPTGHAGITWGNGDLVFAPLFTERMRLSSAGVLSSITGLTVNGDITTTGAGHRIITQASTGGSPGGAGFRLTPGSLPLTFSNGDMWCDNSGVYIRIGGVTKTFTLT